MMVMHSQFCNCQWYTIQTFALLQKKEIYLHTPLQPACWFIHVACPSPTLSLAQCCTRLHTAALSESCESCCGVVYCGVQWGCVLCLCAPVGHSGTAALFTPPRCPLPSTGTKKSRPTNKKYPSASTASRSCVLQLPLPHSTLSPTVCVQQCQSSHFGGNPGKVTIEIWLLSVLGKSPGIA